MSLVNEVDGVAVTEHIAVGRDRALCRPTKGIFLGEGTSDYGTIGQEAPAS